MVWGVPSLTVSVVPFTASVKASPRPAGVACGDGSPATASVPPSSCSLATSPHVSRGLVAVCSTQSLVLPRFTGPANSGYRFRKGSDGSRNSGYGSRQGFYGSRKISDGSRQKFYGSRKRVFSWEFTLCGLGFFLARREQCLSGGFSLQGCFRTSSWAFYEGFPSGTSLTVPVSSVTDPVKVPNGSSNAVTGPVIGQSLASFSFPDSWCTALDQEKEMGSIPPS